MINIEERDVIEVIDLGERGVIEVIDLEERAVIEVKGDEELILTEKKGIKVIIYVSNIVGIWRCLFHNILSMSAFLSVCVFVSE